LAGGIFVSAVDHKRKQVAGDSLARVRWLKARPRAALTVDHYEDDWSALAWVQVVGSVQVMAAREAPELVAALVSRYPQYRERPPAGPVLALRPDRLLWWQA
jgi:PPOX class probable F420-dependent enzyme